MRDRESREPTTVLDHLRPTVVRRRVVVDVAALNQQKRESSATTEPTLERSSGCYPRAGAALEDEGPPSSIIAPEAYDALGDERDERDERDELDEQEEDDRAPSTREPAVRAYEDFREEVGETEGQLRAPAQPSVEAAPVVDPRPKIPVGPTIAVGTIAKRLGLSSAQVAAELVSRGFFEVTPATVLTRETARIVAEAFGRAVEEIPDPEPVKARRKRTVRRAAPTKRAAKSTKPKKRAARSTRRAA